MKCPKCLYIGFETGDRCKNCGYDFSLLALAEEEAAPELAIREPEPATDAVLQAQPETDLALDLSPASGAWLAPALAESLIDRYRDLPEPDGPAMTLAGPAFDIKHAPAATPLPTASSAAAPGDTPALPLFAPDAADDEPLIKLPAAPRPPLAVRRTPETPRLRPGPPIERQLHEDAVLQFVEEPEEPERPAAPPAGRPVLAASFDVPVEARRGTSLRAEAAADASPFGRRAVAAIIDHGILLGIDLVVLYFTLRLTDLTFSEWRVLPALPLAAFLLSLKVAYLSAFTTAGGQTIGKMATHIRVVSDDGGGLDAGRALRRAVVGLASIAAAGAPFLAALADPLRRGVHDRASGSRVVALPAR